MAEGRAKLSRERQRGAPKLQQGQRPLSELVRIPGADAAFTLFGETEQVSF